MAQAAVKLIIADSKKVHQTIEDAFPDLDCNEVPLGDFIVIQLRKPPEKVGNLFMSEETREQESFDNYVGIVREIGPDAFKFFDDKSGQLKNWPGALRYQVGDYVRVPKHPRLGIFKKVQHECIRERINYNLEGAKTTSEKVTENVVFCIIQEREIISKIIDPIKEINYRI